MKPGDVVTCPSCGAEGRAWTTVPSSWKEGDALLVTWLNGPHARHTPAIEAPVLCMWCDDRRLGFPALIDRPLPSEAPWVAGGPRCTFEIPPVCLRAPGERSAGEGPLNAEPEDVREDARPRPRLDGNKAPLERFEELAKAYHAETGAWPYGYALADVKAGEAIDRSWEPWRDWCAARARKGADKERATPRAALAEPAVEPPPGAKPQSTTRHGQLSLFGGSP